MVETEGRRSRPPAQGTAPREPVRHLGQSSELPDSGFRLHRGRLFDALEEASCAFLLLSAPAGTGKTTLAVEWADISRERRTVVWLNCHDGQTDPMQDLVMSLGPAGRMASVAPIPSLAREELLRQALEAIDRSALPVAVVLDGYHLKAPAPAHELDQLMRHAHGRLQVMLTTRTDPILPLHRYRLEGDMVELRAADLAFTDAEAQRLLQELGADLEEADVHVLNERLRGWAAGLRFAARAVVGRRATHELVSAAVTYNGDINSYLVGEVLNSQPPRLRELMLTISVPDVLEPLLLEELTGRPAAPTSMELNRANVFLEDLPGDAPLIRYAPFFRDLLRAQLAYESPERMVALHRTAAAWYVRQRRWDRAVFHLAETDDMQNLIDLLVEQLLVPRLLCEPDDGALRQAVSGLRHERVQGAHAHLLVAAQALLDDDPERCDVHLSAARSDSALQALGAVTAAVLDAARAARVEDASTAAQLAAEAEERLLTHSGAAPASSIADARAVVVLQRATAALRSGQLEQARRLLQQALGSSTASWSPAYRGECVARVAVLAAYEGRLVEADRAVAEALDLGCRHDMSAHQPSVPATAQAVEALVALERYDLRSAENSLAAVAPDRDAMSRALATIVAAGLDRARHRPSAAVGRLDAAIRRLGTSDPWIADWLRIEMAQTRLTTHEAREALAELDKVSSDSAGAAVAAISAHHVAGDEDASKRWLADLNAWSMASLRVRVTGRLAEANLLARVSPLRARSAVREALRTAEPQGLKRPFKETEPVVRALIGQSESEGDWLRSNGVSAQVAGRRTPSGAATDALGLLVDGLTPRELEVLSCMSELLTTEEIAAKLFISINTVRTHVRNILTKLGVSRRNAAVREARRLGLLER